ncbi:hypothetical protein [Nocardia mangyaensis]|uniref:hypothetical protein n=1 Tax=Nocardia mangyaensis TaxID=2213200 RepID=UPI002675F147|nr:hypothetical protein [Nocardia mangyaensis]MDO3651163.1 hypothetical protein [Nocardia mangyaensis]
MIETLFDYCRVMQEGDLVRLGGGGVSQFRVLEVDGDRALVQSTLEVPGSYPFAMRAVDLHPWSE